MVDEGSGAVSQREITEVMKQGFLVLEGSTYKTLRRNLQNPYWEITMLKRVLNVHSAVNKHDKRVT